MSLVVAVFLVLLICALLQNIRRNIWGAWKDAPPGPWSLPLLGSLFLLPTFGGRDSMTFPVLAICKMADKYGQVMTLAMGSQITVFLSGLADIKYFCSLDETTLRPKNPILLDMYSAGRDLGIGIGLGGERWREQRKFALKTMKDVSGGRTTMAEKIMLEVGQLIMDIKRRLKESGEDRLNKMDTYFDVPELNVIWEMVADKRYSYDDPVPYKQFHYLNTFLGESKAGPITIFPSLKYVPPFKKAYHDIRVAMDGFRFHIRDVVGEQRSTFDPDQPARGYIDKFLLEQRENRGKYFDDDNLIINCQDLFIGGAETTSKTMSNCVLYLILNVDVQRKVQGELDAIVGRGRPVCLEDRPNLVYTEATLMEVRRISTPFPISPPRTSSRDLTLQGYRIPAGVPVQLNFYALLRSEEHFGNPEQFRPERFLNEAGNELVIPEAFIPFGYGKRRCIGEELSSVSNFLFLANLAHNFNMRCIDEKKPPSTLPCGGLTYGPQTFDVKISVR